MQAEDKLPDDWVVLDEESGVPRPKRRGLNPWHWFPLLLVGLIVCLSILVWIKTHKKQIRAAVGGSGDDDLIFAVQTVRQRGTQSFQTPVFSVKSGDTVYYQVDVRNGVYASKFGSIRLFQGDRQLKTIKPLWGQENGVHRFTESGRYSLNCTYSGVVWLVVSRGERTSLDGLGRDDYFLIIGRD